MAFHHPADFAIGKRVHWRRPVAPAGRSAQTYSGIMTGYVTKILDDKSKPAYVRSNGRTYKPHLDDYCAEDGRIDLKTAKRMARAAKRNWHAAKEMR